MAKELGFEERVEAAKKIMEQLMDPEIPLEKSVKLYKEGMELLKEAGKILEEAKIEVETIEKEEIDPEELI
ncbi:exodeoxyribonuclease VII small subunit [Hydrogenimonas thermophila]|uniref:Exodeoxyribonuclease 7 small subunit n=1 Tax=Hydrogenimonas thermophila TaxID=223786 RepID=A0A1I5KT89_9BACT|nr:exodeoxyribonuclease VII small subunit [Hydrogenimonas thermophila]WOE69412.1 exodeoxyribonuclease VII small subunit [Hydrogenimonas thermophila]WOE71921.1 exodeoxyribonuclease VII small subunit [Hydrogenimonas thermophila]SFO88304.1 Exodeoxyribonuclease VII small subunit [Hydrogenimonas thermophila]